MKGGVLLAAAAVERLAAAPSRPFSEVRLLVCADEETRLRAPAVCAEAKGAAAALVFECARENGDLVSERKGAIWRTLRLHGRPAHAGADTHRGRSAVSALAQEIVRIEALAAGRPEMTSVITTVRGGDSMNTVPGEALATIDIRSSVPGDLVFALAELERDGAYDGVTGEIENRGTWPPMPRTPWLVDLARSLATELGLDVGEQHSGGVSDGCWTGAEGIPTIDGLGPVGGDDHTPSEWIEIETLEARIELAARLIEAVSSARRVDRDARDDRDAAVAILEDPRRRTGLVDPAGRFSTTTSAGGFGPARALRASPSAPGIAWMLRYHM